MGSHFLGARFSLGYDALTRGCRQGIDRRQLPQNASLRFAYRQAIPFWVSFFRRFDSSRLKHFGNALPLALFGTILEARLSRPCS